MLSLLKTQEINGRTVTEQESLLVEVFDYINAVQGVPSKAQLESHGLSEGTADIADPSSMASSSDRSIPSSSSRVQQYYLSSKKRTTTSSTTGGSLSTKKMSKETKIDKVKAILSRRQSGITQPPSTNMSVSGGANIISTSSNVNSRRSTSAKKNPLAELLGTQPPKSGLAELPVRATNRRHTLDNPQPMVMLNLPPESYLLQTEWDSRLETSEAIHLPLLSPNYDGNNTLVITCTIPTSAHRCSLNLCSRDKSGTNQNINYSFNPRRTRNFQILQNTKTGHEWGLVESLATRQPLVFGTKFQLRLTLTRSGFAVFLGDQFQQEYAHRIPLREGDVLSLEVPKLDDYGNPETVVIHNVWWGHAEPPPPQGKHPSSSYPPHHHHGTSSSSSRHHHHSYPTGHHSSNHPSFRHQERKFDVYVGGLTSEITRQDIEQAFQGYSVSNVRLMPEKGFGFVSLGNVEEVERAIGEMSGKNVKSASIRVSRARGSVQF